MPQVGQESRPDAGCPERAVNITLLVGAFFDEAKDFMHLNDFALHTGNLSDADHPTLAIGEPLHLNQQPDRRRDLASNAGGTYRHASHTDHLFQALGGITRRVSVHSGHQSFVAGVHGLKHIECFLTSALADDNSIWTHPKGILHELALANLALAFSVRWPSL